LRFRVSSTDCTAGKRRQRRRPASCSGSDELPRRGIDFELRLIGDIKDQNLEQEMTDEIRRKDLSDRATLTGWIPLERAQEEIAAADVGLCLLHPIPNYLNSLAMKILEYMRFGVPVVASDFPCWREYVTDVGSGIQVDPFSIPAIADAIE